MRRVLYIGILLAFCSGVYAQDSTAKRFVDRAADLDSAYAVLEDSVTAEAEDTTFEEEEATAEENTSTNLEQKIRNKTVPHALWDDQYPGVWNDEAQGRLSRQEVPADKMKALREMKALQYNKPPRKGNTWWLNLGSWVSAHINFFRYLFCILLGGLFLAAVILFIRKNDIPLFRRSRQKMQEADVLIEHGPQNYDALARAAIDAGNWREAVRMRYLHALQLLEARQLIAPGKDKTNMDYLRELSSTAWYKPFAKLTLHYEYVWYGQQPLNNGQFAQLDDQFSAFKKSLR